MLILIAVLTFASVTLTALAVQGARPRQIAERAGVPVEPGRRRTEGGILPRLLGPATRQWGRRVTAVLPHNFVRTIDRMLVMADEPWSLPSFMLTWLAAVLGGVALFWYIVEVSPALTALQTALYGSIILPLTAIAPYALLRGRVRRRQTAIIRALPDAMDLLVTSVEAGLGIDAAFAVVAEKTTGPMSQTISFYLRQVGLGVARREALMLTAERTGVTDLTGVARSVSQAEQLGTTLGDVLRVQAEDLRRLRRQRAQTAAQRAPVLMTIPMTLCFLPAMGAVVVVPSILNLLRFVGGLGHGA